MAPLDPPLREEELRALWERAAQERDALLLICAELLGWTQPQVWDKLVAVLAEMDRRRARGEVAE